jgi:transposase
MQGEGKMGKKKTERRVYPKEFNAEAAAPAEKREKPVSHIAVDLGISEKILYRWMQVSRRAKESGIYQTAGSPFPGHGRPRDEELSRLRKEARLLREANEILKKTAAIFAQGESR